MSAPVKRVLFVCIGNACRSQMAEAFARAYGSDVVVAASAGLAPGVDIPPDTHRAMKEKNIDLRDHFPKALHYLGRAEFDLVVNMSGVTLPVDTGCPVRTWEVKDPYTLPYPRHCEVRDRIERLVMELVMELRQDGREPRFHSLHSSH